MRKRVVVTGGSGYIGSVLCQKLVDSGFDVTVLDRFFFGNTIPDSPYITKIKIDSRQISQTHLEGVFAVLDLAALSNDPAGELDPIKTLDINYRARRRLQELAADAKVDRYILASSCSVYGFQDGVLDENSDTNPLTTYAEANLKAEDSALQLHNAGTDMAVTLFRQATMYGLSPRMRFDIAINGMTLGMWQNGSIPMLRDGTQWRPFIHVRDTSKAFILALQANKNLVSGERFNVGSNDQNYQIMRLGELVAKGIGKKFDFTWYGDPDHRSYQVNFDKIEKILGFTPDWTPVEGAKEIADALESRAVKPDIYTKTLAWYTELLEWEKRMKDLAPDGNIF
jgi:nucleoside-diphosphate-sugar epimerase